MATVHVYAKRRGYPTYPRATLQRGVRVGAGLDPGADDAVHHHRRQDLRLVHRHRVGLHRGALRRRCCRFRLPRDGAARGCYGALLDTGKLAGGRAVLRRHGARLRLAARLLPDPEGAARRASPPGAWGRSPPASSSPACSSSSAASSTPSRRSSSSARSCSRWRKRVGMDPVHFAMIGIVSLAFGLVTPPYGLCLMISCAIARMPHDRRAEGHDDHAGADVRGAGAGHHLAADRRCSCRGCSRPACCDGAVAQHGDGEASSGIWRRSSTAVCATASKAFRPGATRSRRWACPGRKKSIKDNGLTVTGVCRGGFFAEKDWKSRQPSRHRGSARARRAGADPGGRRHAAGFEGSFFLRERSPGLHRSGPARGAQGGRAARDRAAASDAGAAAPREHARAGAGHVRRA